MRERKTRSSIFRHSKITKYKVRDIYGIIWKSYFQVIWVISEPNSLRAHEQFLRSEFFFVFHVICSTPEKTDSNKNNIVPAGQRELDLAVVHLGDKGPPALAGGHGLAPDDLDGVGPGSVSGSHVSVALGDGAVHGQVTVLPAQKRSFESRTSPYTRH